MAMNSELLCLQDALRAKKMDSATVQMALNQIKEQPPAISQQVIIAFKSDHRIFNFLCVNLLLLNGRFPPELAEQLSNFASGNALSLFCSLLYDITYLLPAPAPTDKYITLFHRKLRGLVDYASFTTTMDDFHFEEFKLSRLQDLAAMVLFESPFECQPDGLCQYVNLFLALEGALAKRAIVDEKLYESCKNVGYSSSSLKTFAAASVANRDAKRHMMTIYSILALCSPLNTFIHSGVLIGLPCSDAENPNRDIVKSLLEDLPDPAGFTRCVVGVYEEISLMFTKAVVVEFLALWMYRYYCALVFGGANEQKQRMAFNNISGFLLNLSGYSSIGAAVQLGALELLISTYLRSGDFLNVIFATRKLQELEVLSIAPIDHLTIYESDLAQFSVLLMLNERQIQANASHVAKLCNFAASMSRLKEYAAGLRVSTFPEIRLYYALISAEVSCFDNKTFYGDIFHTADGQIMELLNSLAGQRTARESAIFWLKEVESITHEHKISSNMLAERFKILEYSLAGEIEKAVQSLIISSGIREIVEIYTQPAQTWVFSLCRIVEEVNHTNRTLLTKMSPEEASFAIAKQLNCEDSAAVKIMLSDASMRNNTFIFLEKEQVIAKIPLFNAPFKLSFKIMSGMEPENVLEEIEALKALSQGNLIKFISCRFQSLMSSLEHILEEQKENKTNIEEVTSSLQTLEAYLSSFYRALPLLLFGPFCGIPIVKSHDEQYVEALTAASEAVVSDCGLMLEISAAILMATGSDQEAAIEAIKSFEREVVVACIEPTFVEFEFAERISLPRYIHESGKTPLYKSIIRVAIDPLLQQIPIEKTASFPSAIRFLSTRSAQQLSEAQAQTEHQGRGFYYIDPSLQQTEEKIRGALNSVKEAWEQITDAEELISELAKADRFLYAGHGGGENLMPRHRISALERLPEAAVLGCASMCGMSALGGALHYQPCNAWEESRFLVGCLWDMLGSELDRFAVAWAKAYGFEGFRAGLAAVRWKYCTSMGIVAWG